MIRAIGRGGNKQLIVARISRRRACKRRIVARGLRRSKGRGRPMRRERFARIDSSVCRRSRCLTAIRSVTDNVRNLRLGDSAARNAPGRPAGNGCENFPPEQPSTVSVRRGVDRRARDTKLFHYCSIHGKKRTPKSNRFCVAIRYREVPVVPVICARRKRRISPPSPLRIIRSGSRADFRAAHERQPGLAARSAVRAKR